MAASDVESFNKIDENNDQHNKFIDVVKIVVTIVANVCRETFALATCLFGSALFGSEIFASATWSLGLVRSAARCSL